MRSRRTALACCCDDRRPALDNDLAERAPRRVAIGHRNYLFAGSDTGRHRAAALYPPIESAMLNGRNPASPSGYGGPATISAMTSYRPAGEFGP